MTALAGLLDGTPALVNVGVESFAAPPAAHGAEVVHVDWRPPADGDDAIGMRLARLVADPRIEAANAEALERMLAVRPHWVDVARAGDVLPELDAERLLLHAGPPIAWERVCDPQRRALEAACLFEGWAGDRERARGLLGSGAVALRSGNDHHHVGPMTGVCSPSMPVWVVEDAAAGVRAFSTLNEGPGNTLWFGVGDDESVERLRNWASPQYAADPYDDDVTARVDAQRLAGIAGTKRPQLARGACGPDDGSIP